MPSRPSTYRNAEEEVSKLCRALGASVQKVSEDDNGWDLLVEFPPRIETAFPDVDDPLTRCLVQVKSVQSRKAVTQIKVSNALKFAKDPLPCFVALVTYPTGPKRNEAIYLRHVWATDMAQALKAARQQAANGQPLNRKKLSVAFTPMERVDDNLAEAMLEAISREGIDYAGKKQNLCASLGCEDGWGEGSMVLAEGHNAQDLQDLLLGLRPDLPIQNFSASEVRFGIRGPQSVSGAGTLSIDNLAPTDRCVLTLTRRNTGEQLTWSGGMFTAGMGWLPAAQQRLRVVAGPMELVVTGEGKVTGDWSAPLSARRPLDDLEREAIFRSWMDGSKIDLEVWTTRGSLPAANMVFNGDQQDEPPWSDVIVAIQALSKVVAPERRPADLVVSMNEFLAGLEQHTVFSSLCKADSRAMRVVNKKRSMEGIENATHIVFPWVSRLGDYLLVSVIERQIANAYLDGLNLNLLTNNGRLLRGTAMKRTEATDALVAGEVQWAKERAMNSDKAIISFHPEGEGIGTLVLSTPD